MSQTERCLLRQGVIDTNPTTRIQLFQGEASAPMEQDSPELTRALCSRRGWWRWLRSPGGMWSSRLPGLPARGPPGSGAGCRAPWSGQNALGPSQVCTPTPSVPWGCVGNKSKTKSWLWEANSIGRFYRGILLFPNGSLWILFAEAEHKHLMEYAAGLIFCYYHSESNRHYQEYLGSSSFQPRYHRAGGLTACSSSHGEVFLSHPRPWNPTTEPFWELCQVTKWP